MLKALIGKQYATLFMAVFFFSLLVIELLPSVSLEKRYIILENCLTLRNVLANVIKLK